MKLMNRKSLLFVGDVLCFIAGFLLFILVAFGRSRFAAEAKLHAAPLSILVILWLIIFFVFNFYEVRSSKPNLVFLRNFGIAAILMLAVGFIFFYIKPITSVTPKTHLVIFEGISLILVLIWRRVFYLATVNVFHTRFAIICTDKRHETLVHSITENPHLGYLFRGSYATLSEFFSIKPEVDLVIIHKTPIDESALLKKLFASHIDVISLAEAYENILYRIPAHFIDNQWIIHSIKKQNEVFYSISSRILSVSFAVLVGLITLPISLIIIMAIKLEDRGPLFIRQSRTGLHGKTFSLYKFRSMIATDQDGQAENGKPSWADGHQDSRITKVGSITRRLHIDEIPQMINLLKGDLDLVGPRPERPEFVQKLEREIPYYFMRHTIKPGFTGWAQIKFRYARTVMDSQEKFEYDLYYLKNRNILLDFGIVLKTVQVIFTH
jgi:lipopolysaccharide/colanic/teichoic acid biosynthesis glycosyltransferase